jgi:hypothetical protein
MTKSNISSAMALVGAVLLRESERTMSVPTWIDVATENEADSLTSAASAFRMRRDHLLEVLVFSRTILHNRLVGLRDDANVTAVEATAMVLLAGLLDQIPDVYFDLDCSVAEKRTERVPVALPECLRLDQNEMAFPESEALRLIGQYSAVSSPRVRRRRRGSRHSLLKKYLPSSAGTTRRQPAHVQLVDIANAVHRSSEAILGRRKQPASSGMTRVS